MLTYMAALTRLGKRDSRKLENNTYLVRLSDSCIGVMLHSTYVVRIYNDGTWTLHTGGWRSVTTKDRINTYSPARVYQQKGEWYLAGKVPFYDGMRVDANGAEVLGWESVVHDMQRWPLPEGIDPRSINDVASFNAMLDAIRYDSSSPWQRYITEGANAL
jgi:hypothetical protein